MMDKSMERKRVVFNPIHPLHFSEDKYYHMYSETSHAVHYTFLVAKAVHQDLRQDDNGTATLTSFSESPETLPSTDGKITLQVGTNAKILRKVEIAPTDIEEIR